MGGWGGVDIEWLLLTAQPPHAIPHVDGFVRAFDGGYADPLRCNGQVAGGSAPARHSGTDCDVVAAVHVPLLPDPRTFYVARRKDHGARPLPAGAAATPVDDVVGGLPFEEHGAFDERVWHDCHQFFARAQQVWRQPVNSLLRFLSAAAMNVGLVVNECGVGCQ